MHNHADDGSRSASSSIIKPLIQPSAHEDSREQEGDTERTAPQRVHHSKAALALDLAFDVILLAVGLGFLSLAVASQCFDGKSISENKNAAKMVLGASSIGPTLLPIAFAVILGRACKSIFMWRFESGERVGTLDLLAGSTSLASTILTHLALRSFVVLVSPLLLVIWILSPIGGQASLRVITTEMFNSSAPLDYFYLIRENYYAEMFWYYYDDHKATLLDTFFASALLAPADIKNSPRDLWFNVKTPMIEEFEHKDPSDGDWYEVGSANTTVYSSMIGTPIFNMSSEVHYASMNIETSYWRLKCAPLFDHQPNIDELDSAWQQLHCDHSSSRQFPKLERCLSFTQIKFVDEQGGESTGGGSAVCSIGTTYVELHANCEWGLCAATRVRRSRSLRNAAASWTYIDEYPGGIDNFTQIKSRFSTGGAILELYIPNPNDPLNVSNHSLQALSSDAFAIHYAQVLNTAWTSLGTVSSLVDGGFRSSKNATGTTKGSSTTSTKVFRYHRTWMWILVVTSLVMILATMLHIALLFIIKASKQLDINISSLVRDNRYVLFPMTGSAADASERAQRVKNCYVRYGDVQPDEPVGYLAIGSVDEDSLREEKGGMVERVRRDRYYV